jgi:hypothetical protein
MTLSTTVNPSAITNTATCPTAGWCAGHHETHPNVVLHLSDFHVGAGGAVTAIKAYSWGDGEPIGRASVMTFKPRPGTPTTPEDWRLEYLRSVASAA